VALENYTKFQKIMLLVLVVVGAALFTVTGAMMAVAEGCGKTGGYTRIAGTVNGQDVTRELFQAREFAMQLGYDILVPVYPEESIAKTLLINNIPDGEAPFHGKGTWGNQFGYGLFSLWPRKHDQRIWLFAALVERAKAAGFRLPPQAAAGEFYFRRVSPDKIMNEDERRRHFSESQRDPNVMLLAVAEVMMVRDYVASIVSRHTATTDEALAAYRARFNERKADIYRVEARKFLAHAEAEIAAAEAAASAASAASALSGGGAFGATLSPSKRLNLFPTPAEKLVLEREQKVAFDLIVADYRELMDNIPTPSTEELRSFYSNIRGQSFRVSPADATAEKIDERYKRVLEREKEVLAGAEPNEDWKTQTKADLKWFYDYHERSDVVISQLKLSNAQSLARAAIESINTDLEEKRKEIKDGLDAEVKTLRERKSIPDARLGMLNSVNDQFKPLLDSPLDEITRAIDTWKEGTANDAAAVDGLFAGITQAITRPSGNSAANKAGELRRFVNLDQEKRAVRDREIEVEDTIDLQKRVPPGEKDYEGKQKVARAQIKVEAAKARLEEAEKLKPLLDVLADKIDAYVVDIELRSLAAQNSANAAEALRQLCREIAFEWPLKVRAWTKDVVSEDRRTELEAAGALVDREAERATRQADRTSKDQSAIQFSSIVRGVKIGRGMTVNLRYDDGIDADAPMTLKRLAASEDYFWVENVTKAKSFLTNTDNPVGTVSEVLHRPGFGYYLMRLKHNQETVDLSAGESPEVARRVLVARRARELAKAEAEQLRALADQSPNAVAFLDAQVAAGNMTKTSTDWFGWHGTVTGINLVPDPDSDSATGLDDSKPMANFFNAFKAIGPTSSVSTPFLEGQIDWNDRAGGGSYQYSLAVLTGQRTSSNKDRLPSDGFELDQIQVNGIALNPRLAADKDLVRLIDPGLLLEGFTIVYDTGIYDEREANKDKPAGKSDDKPADNGKKA